MKIYLKKDSRNGIGSSVVDVNGKPLFKGVVKHEISQEYDGIARLKITMLLNQNITNKNGAELYNFCGFYEER